MINRFQDWLVGRLKRVEDKMWHQKKQNFKLRTIELQELSMEVLDIDNINTYVQRDVFGDYSAGRRVYLGSSNEGDYILSTKIETPGMYSGLDLHPVSIEVFSSGEKTVSNIMKKIEDCNKKIISGRKLEAHV